MPLVKIHIAEGRSPDLLQDFADTVHEVICQEFAAPESDRFQLVIEYPIENMILLDTGLGFERTEAKALIEIVQQGRSKDQKQNLYARLASALSKRGHLQPQDLVVTVLSNGSEDWSFGYGQAQFLTGDLPNH